MGGSFHGKLLVITRWLENPPRHHDILRSAPGEARPGLRQAHRPNGLSGPLGPSAVPGATLRGAGVAGHAADALAAGGVRCGVAGEEGDVFGDGEMVRFP